MHMFSGITSQFPSLSFIDFSTNKGSDADQLGQAVAKGDFATVEKMIQGGSNPATKDAYGFSAIDYTILDGKAEKLPLLFNKKLSEKEFDTVVGSGYSVLNFLADFSHLRIFFQN